MNIKNIFIYFNREFNIIKNPLYYKGDFINQGFLLINLLYQSLRKMLHQLYECAAMFARIYFHLTNFR